MASSTLNNYPVSNILDHDFSTAWVEGGIGNGIGEKIRIELSEPILLEQIIIMNGYQKSLKTYLENNIVKKLKITTSPGFSFIVDLPKED